MTRDMKLYELRMLVLGYMQNEDPKKAAEVFEKWIQVSTRSRPKAAEHAVCRQYPPLRGFNTQPPEGG